jgi:dGTPase
MNRAALRETRRHEDDQVHAPRTEFERDRDRVLHSTALRRLGRITQVVSAAEGHVFHNRLTHVLKVAQIARGIAEELLASKERKELAQQLGGLNAHVAETAALAHDLGHPPFGHIAEHRLDTLLKEHQVLDGLGRCAW